MGTRAEDNDGGRDTMKPKTTGQAKKTYRSPRLGVYGDLRRLTMTKGGTRSDGVGAAKSKTTGSQ
jgi:hypothetical protein